MAGLKRLERPVRPRAEDLIDEEGSEDGSEDDFSGLDDEAGGSSPSLLDTGEGGDVITSDDDETSGADLEGDDDVAAESSAQEQLKAVSFGTLAKAQDAVSRKRKRGSDANDDQERKLEALRARLAEIKETKGKASKKASASKAGKSGGKDVKSGGKHAKTASHADSDGAESTAGDDEDEDDDDHSDDADDGAPKSRSSKHAPTSQSTRYQVTRKRDVVDVRKSQARDPRFGPGAGGSSGSGGRHGSKHGAAVGDAGRAERAYGFLREYEDGEMGELRAAIKKTRSEEDKEVLRRKLMSMENRRRAGAAREREREVLREHRRKEREAVRDGKTPFFLKRGEVRSQAQARKVEGMKKGEREKAEARKRKKVAQREMKAMPAPRRIT